MLWHPPQAAGGCTKANNRKVVADDADRARTGREKGGKQQSQPLTASVGLTKHGVVAVGERQNHGGQRGGGSAVRREGPKDGPTAGHFVTPPKAASPAVEGEFEWPKPVVGAGGQRAGNREFDAIGQSGPGTKGCTKVPAVPTPTVAPLGRGSPRSDDPGRGEPPSVGRKPTSMSRLGP